MEGGGRDGGFRPGVVGNVAILMSPGSVLCKSLKESRNFLASLGLFVRNAQFLCKFMTFMYWGIISNYVNTAVWVFIVDVLLKAKNPLLKSTCICFWFLSLRFLPHCAHLFYVN